MMKIGEHIPKRGQFFNTLNSFYEQEGNMGKPTQLFTGSPRFWRRPFVHNQDIDKTRKYVRDNKLSVYIHSIYLVNLCRSPEEFKRKARNYLIWELQMGCKLGFKGVVVHCGKSLQMPIQIALKNMYDNISSVLSDIDFNCPLLLETSSGQGTETLWKYNDLKQFYARFTKSQQSCCLKICIDTCHVFAAGHDPLKFIIDWDKDFPQTLVLVHFNDSKEECGKKKDRHELPGEGHIGMEKMNQIETWCRTHPIIEGPYNSYPIPMIIEHR